VTYLHIFLTHPEPTPSLLKRKKKYNVFIQTIT